ncbi:MAG: hypothetical protein VXW26_16360, partial [SAR324 cluster bacterium]|nr:hypothetical protein [SAR324 cluster bacterium]
MWSAKRRPQFTHLRRIFKTLNKSNIEFFLHNGSVHNWFRQETAKIHVPSSGLKTQKNRKT